MKEILLSSKLACLLIPLLKICFLKNYYCVYVLVCSYVCVHAYMLQHVCICVCVYVCVHVHACMPQCMCVRAYVPQCVCTCLYATVYMCVLCVCIYASVCGGWSENIFEDWFLHFKTGFPLFSTMVPYTAAYLPLKLPNDSSMSLSLSLHINAGIPDMRCHVMISYRFWALKKQTLCYQASMVSIFTLGWQ